MRVVIAADHAGFPLKQELVEHIKTLGHDCKDLGTDDPTKPDDYPDYAELACEALRTGAAERAVIVCGSGVGVGVAANKFPGIRAGICHDTYSAHQGVEHDNMNVLCIGARIIGTELAREIISAFLSVSFTGEKRHVRRLKKVRAIEKRFMPE